MHLKKATAADIASGDDAGDEAKAGPKAAPERNQKGWDQRGNERPDGNQVWPVSLATLGPCGQPLSTCVDHFNQNQIMSLRGRHMRADLWGLLGHTRTCKCLMAAISNYSCLAIKVTSAASSRLLSLPTSHRVGCWLCGNSKAHPDSLIRTLTLRCRSIVHVK